MFVTSGIVSVRNASLELARRLDENGFRVTYASPSDIKDAVEERGLPFVQLGPAADAMAQPRRSLVARLVRLFRLRERRHAEVDGLGVEVGIAALDKLSPDLVLIDLELHGHVIGAASLRAPVALLTVWLALSKRPGLAPLHRFILPQPGLRGSVAVEWAWLRYRLWKAARRRLDWFRRAGTDRVSVLRVLAARSGFSFRAETDMWQWPFPFSYRRLPLLHLNAYELDLPHSPPSNARYVGPMIAEATPGDPSDEVERILARRTEESDPAPFIYAAFGSFFKGDDTGFIRRFLEAVESRSDWEVLLALGGRLSPEVFGSQPAHVRILEWVPQMRLISKADAAVLHGGITSINECLWSGVPMLVYPLKTNDQLGTAVRVEHHGVGIVGDRDVDTVTDIHRKLDTIVVDAKYRQRAGKMRDQYRAYDRNRTAIAVVEELFE